MDTVAMEALLRAWRDSSNVEALGEMLKAHRDRAYSTALRLTGSESDAEDVVQQAFMKLLSRTAGFENLESFEQSVYRAVVQCGLDSIRQRKRQVAREAVIKEQSSVVQTANTQEDREVLTLLRSAVQELPEDERAPVVLCYYQGLSTSSAAETLELPRETVRARLNRALEHLRSVLRRNNKDDRIALLLPMLWRDGNISAPATLCENLDKILPGKACAQVPALSQPGPAAIPPAPVAPAFSMVAGGVAAAVVLVVMMMSKSRPTPPPPMPIAPVAVPAVSEGETASAAINEKESVTKVQAPAGRQGVEVELVNEKPVAPAVASPNKAPAATSAAPNEDAASAIAEIAARRAVKEREAAKVAAKQREWEQLDRGAPGQPLIFEIREGEGGGIKEIRRAKPGGAQQ